MPHVAITMHPGRTDEIKKRLSEKVQAFKNSKATIKRNMQLPSIKTDKQKWI